MKSFYRFKKQVSQTITCLMLLFFSMMLLCNPVSAQGDTSSEDKNTGDEFTLEEIRVTGSRIRTSGMDTPTPVTVVTTNEIDFLSPNAMVDGLAELPQFAVGLEGGADGSATTQNPSAFFTSTGAGNLSLRGLQSKRTLQLLDGRRVVPSTIFGGPDINLFPEFLLRSVETVTGGASAAYGTDAVAGVVNFILDTEYEGIKGKVQYGQNEKGDNKNHEFSIAGGFAVTDQLHVLVSAESSRQDGVWLYDLQDYGWYDAWSLLDNPDTENRGTSPDNPYYLPARKVYSINATLDGILHFPDSAGGRYIFDENGVAVPLERGDLCNNWGCSQVNGGNSIDNMFESGTSQISPETSRENFFGYVDYDVSHKLTVYGQAMYGKAEFTSKNAGGVFPNALGRQFTIYSGNPFLPAEMQQIMDDNSLASVALGRLGSLEDLAPGAYAEQSTKTLSLTTGFDYNVSSGFLDGWQIKSYYQYGETDVKAIQKGGIRLDRVYLAADVVIDPLTGQPACNVSVVSRDAGNPIYQDCVPLNLFGRGQASPEAVDWVVDFEPGFPINAEGFLTATETLPHSYISGQYKQRLINIQQHVFEFSADGEIYKGWGAGPLRMGLGYNYREESFDQVVESGPGGNINADPTFRPVMANDPALGIRGVPGGAAASGNSVEIQFSNVPFALGDQNVHEVFDEIFVPLLADLSFVKQLNYSGAVRWAKYSGSGDVYSWKNGLDWSLNDELRFRGTISQDVRAATIGEKFDRTGGVAVVTDYLIDPAGGTSYSVTTFSNGSPDIRPEEARTNTVGAVYMPGWLEGLSISVDWYSIDVSDNINQTNAAAVVSGCYQDNNVDYCELITRTADPGPGETTNRISLVGVPYLNQASVKGEGVDFELSYRRFVNWFGGGESIALRFLGSYLSERSSTDSAGTKTEFQGSLGYPEWTALLSGNYIRGGFGLSMQARYEDSMLLSRNWNFNGASTRWDVFDNTIESSIYVDARANYRFDMDESSLNLFLNVNNLLNRWPEQYLGAPYSGVFFNNTGLGVVPGQDRLGRRFVVGLTFEFK